MAKSKNARYQIVYIGKNRRVIDTETGKEMSYRQYINIQKESNNKPEIPYLASYVIFGNPDSSIIDDVVEFIDVMRTLSITEILYEIRNAVRPKSSAAQFVYQGLEVNHRIVARLPNEPPPRFGTPYEPLVQQKKLFYGAQRPLITNKEFLITVYVLKVTLPVEQGQYEAFIETAIAMAPKGKNRKFLGGEL